MSFCFTVEQRTMSSGSKFLYRIVQASSCIASSTSKATATVSASVQATSSSGDDNSTAAEKPPKSQNYANQESKNGDATTDQLNVVSSSTDTPVNEEPPTKRPKPDSPLAPPSTSTDADQEIKGVIFDMDGTLTIPVLDFVAMRRELNIPPGVDLLPAILKMPPKEKERSMRIIEKFEEEGAKKLELQPGALDLLHYIAENGVKRALVTRNSMIQTEPFLDRIKEGLSANQEKYPGLSKDSVFSQVLTRDFQPVKPDPAAVFHICKCWSIEPRHTVFVGDDKTDMMCGQRAGVGVRILLKNDRNRGQEDYSDFAVDSLSDVISLLSSPITVTRKN